MASTEKTFNFIPTSSLTLFPALDGKPTNFTEQACLSKDTALSILSNLWNEFFRCFPKESQLLFNESLKLLFPQNLLNFLKNFFQETVLANLYFENYFHKHITDKTLIDFSEGNFSEEQLTQLIAVLYSLDIKTQKNHINNIISLLHTKTVEDISAEQLNHIVDTYTELLPNFVTSSVFLPILFVSDLTSFQQEIIFNPSKSCARTTFNFVPNLLTKINDKKFFNCLSAMLSLESAINNATQFVDNFDNTGNFVGISENQSSIFSKLPVSEVPFFLSANTINYLTLLLNHPSFSKVAFAAIPESLEFLNFISIQSSFNFNNRSESEKVFLMVE